MNNTVEEVVEETYKELFVKALDKIDELERALDKACEKLKQEEASSCFYCDFGHSGADVCDMECWHKSKWKEWLLKDE